jgi:hypothetical protein
VFGRPDDIPVMGDWNGDGTKTAGVVRIIGTSTLSYQWFLRNSNTAGPADIAPFIYGRPSFGFEEPGDFPVTGDWNGDGVDTPGAVRFRNGTTLAGWLLRNSNTGGVANLSFGYGRISDGPPVPGDWNGDGIDTPGIIRGFGQGAFSWLLRNSNTAGAANISAVFGSGLDEPIVGDWDGDGDDGLGVTKQVSTGLGWSLRNTPTTGTVNRSFVYGRSEDLPVIW